MPPDTSPAPPPQEALGPNAWLVDEMYEQYRADPSSVSESWREFFTDYQSDTQAGLDPGRHGPAGHRAQGRRRGRLRPARPPPGAAGRAGDRSRRPRAKAPAATAPRPCSPSGARRPGSWPTWRPASRSPPPPASGRSPAKLLEVNRKVINGYLGRTRGGKISFTHLIGYAVVRAIADSIPVMNSSLRHRRGRQAGASSATSTSTSASPSTSRRRTAAAPCSCR